MRPVVHPPRRRRPTPAALGVLLLAFGLVAGPASKTARSAFDPDTVDFRLSWGEVRWSCRVFGLYVLPNEELTLRLDSVSARSAAYLRFRGDSLPAGSAGTWNWRAPARKGLCTLAVHAGTRDSMVLHVFVMVPYDSLKGESLNGYRIGRYPQRPYRNLAIYRPPRGFVEVTAANADTKVSPHFTLKQFLCKQAAGYPAYLVLRELLLLKLELILSEMNRRGHACTTLAVLSGFRTPYYNHAIGNVKYSRHQWGGAADIYIDRDPADGMMDDLNRDGRIDWKDAAVLYDAVDDMYGQRFYESFVGGLGRYGRTANHGPFVHVDVRGFRARWGD